MEISFWWLDSRQCKQGDGNKWQIPFEEFARLSRVAGTLCAFAGLSSRTSAFRGMNLALASSLTNAILSLNVLFALMGRGTVSFLFYQTPGS